MPDANDAISQSVFSGHRPLPQSEILSLSPCVAQRVGIEVTKIEQRRLQTISGWLGR